MGFQAAHDRMKGNMTKVQSDSSVTGLLPRYYPVSSNNGAEDGEDAKPASLGLATRWTVPQLFFTCSLLSFIFSGGSAIGLGWGYLMAAGGLQHCPGPGEGPVGEAAASARLVDTPLLADDGQDDATADSCFNAMIRLHGKQHPFEEVTGVKGHIKPKMYGKVQEKTIWAYWYDPIDCPLSTRCKLPAAVKLCAESIRKNRGGFEVHVLHMDTVRNYVSMIELPLQWQLLPPVRQKETLMNAVLARYGGVALDLNSVLLHPLDDLWTELLVRRATFKGYMYRVNGQPWKQPEATATWFLMSRREGIFSTAVRNQVVNYCDATRYPDLRLGDHSLTPVLGSINASLPSCLEDSMVWDTDACPDPAQPRPLDPELDPPRTDRKLLISDPRDGPLLPFAQLDNYGMGEWRMDDNSTLTVPPPQCSSPKECWQKVVLPRFEVGSLLFVKLFRRGGPLSRRSLKELQADNSTFFRGWLKLAGINVFPGAAGEKRAELKKAGHEKAGHEKAGHEKAGHEKAVHG